MPTSVGQAPRRSGSFRVSTPTRASSPIRPGSTAFANRPTEKAEKTSGKRGAGGSIACRITVDQAIARAMTDSRLSPIAATTHCQCDGGERVADDPPLGAAPPEQRDDDRRERQQQQHPPAPAGYPVEAHRATAAGSVRAPVTSS